MKRRKSFKVRGKQKSYKADRNTSPEAGQAGQKDSEATHQASSSGPFQSSTEQRKTFWETFIRAVEAEPEQIRSLRGASGLVHPTVAIGVDRTRKRLVVVSGDSNGRSAALAQADIQAAYQDYKVILARPIAVNLARAAEALATFFGKPEIGQRDLARLSDERTKRVFEHRAKLLIDAAFVPAIQAVGYAALNAPATWQDVITQLSHVQFMSSSDFTQNLETSKEAKADLPVIRFGALVALDPAEIDRQMGVCSVPLYELSGDEALVFHSGVDIEAARELLRTHHILQYFFPAPDHLALGLIEKKSAPPSTLAGWLEQSPNIGHPFGPSELVASNMTLDELVNVLKEQGFSVEGEFGLELTDSGKASRATVRFKPREGFLSKLSNVVSVKIDLNLNDLFKPSGVP